MDVPQYKAFISYSHQDEKWARWLQSSLERYRVPKRLVGKTTALGPVPKRLRPVFRDREDLSSASDLTTELRTVLAHSDSLVVICSPAAAQSHWVNEEIRAYRSSGGDERIFALIVDGDPAAEQESERCFPPALLESDGDEKREPLAADVRRYADGKHLSKLKILAGILGVRLDELRQRDAQRRFKRRLLYGVAGTLLVLLFTWLFYSEATTRQAAKVQLANTEELLSFMLGNLDRLDPISGLESFEDEGLEQAFLSDQLGFSDLNSEALMSRALEWREAGNELSWEGKTDEALEKFEQSRAAIIEIYRRDGKTPQAVFELGQAEFYVGEIYVQKGDPERARRHWSHYGALTRRLLNAEPNNPVYVMELAYTLAALGALEQMIPVPDSEKSLELLQAAIQYNQMALVLDPGNQEYETSLATSLEWRADAWLHTCSLGNALESRLETVALRRKMLEVRGEDVDLNISLAFTLSGLAGVQQQIGLNDNATDSLREAVDILIEIHREEPENEYIEWESLYREARLARLLVATGKHEQAAEIVYPMVGRIGDLSQTGELNDRVRIVEGEMFNLDHAKLLLAQGDVEKGELLLRNTTLRLARMVQDFPDFRDCLVALAYAVFQYWEHFGEHPAIPAGLLDPLHMGIVDVQSCTDADRLARIAVMDGELDKARSFTDYAVGKGYFDPEFINFCRQYGLCKLP